MSAADDIKRRLLELQLEHRQLDEEIQGLMAEPVHDELLVKRLKKRKLQLRDSIVLLQMQLTPDVPA